MLSNGFWMNCLFTPFITLCFYLISLSFLVRVVVLTGACHHTMLMFRDRIPYTEREADDIPTDTASFSFVQFHILAPPTSPTLTLTGVLECHAVWGVIECQLYEVSLSVNCIRCRRVTAVWGGVMSKELWALWYTECLSNWNIIFF